LLCLENLEVAGETLLVAREGKADGFVQLRDFPFPGNSLVLAQPALDEGAGDFGERVERGELVVGLAFLPDRLLGLVFGVEQAALEEGPRKFTGEIP